MYCVFLITNYNGIWYNGLLNEQSIGKYVREWKINVINDIEFGAKMMNVHLRASLMGEMMRTQGFCGVFQTAPSELVITHSDSLWLIWINPLVNFMSKQFCTIPGINVFLAVIKIDIVLGYGSAPGSASPKKHEWPWVQCIPQTSLGSHFTKPVQPGDVYGWNPPGIQSQLQPARHEK